MLPVDAIIHRVRRDLTISRLLKVVLGFAAAACFLGPDNLRLASLFALAAIWVWLSLSSARNSRVAAASPSLIAAGQFEEAEKSIEQTVRTFSILRTVKLQALHNLALLRHAQRRWQESAALSRALLGQRLGTLAPLSKPARLLLADSLLEMNDLKGAHEALVSLYSEQLNLTEVVSLLAVQLDYMARIGAWAQMLDSVMAKVQFAELLTASSSGRAHAFLALAARKTGRQPLWQWLRARAELLVDSAGLVRERPILAELWI